MVGPTIFGGNAVGVRDISGLDTSNFINQHFNNNYVFYDNEWDYLLTKINVLVYQNKL